MKRLSLAAVICIAVTTVADAGSVSRSYSYFAIGGRTLAEIETELQRRGPELGTTGSRHPGATRMEFKSRVGYGEGGGGCRVVEAAVVVDANVILPRWRHRSGAQMDVGLMWDTLSADIKRHEEGHIVIARNYARKMEQAFLSVTNAADCEAAQQRVQAMNQDLLARHDEEQARYDRVESINFESRMLRLLQYRLDRMENAGG